MSNYSLVSAGGSEKVEAASAINLPVSTSADFTIAFWHLSASSSYVALSQVFGFGSQLPSGLATFDGRYTLQYGGSGDYYFWGLGNDWDSGTAFIQDGAWHHIAWTYDHATTTLKLWVDGSNVATNSSYSLVATAGTYITAFAKHSGGSTSPNLKLCDPAIWSSVLISSNISKLATKTSRPSGLTTNLQMYWPLTEGTGTTAADYTANGNSGTLSGGVTWDTDTPFTSSADTGSGAASFSFTVAGSGQAAATGSGAASVSFTVTAAGKADATGSGAATVSFTAAGTGKADAIGSGAATFSFTAAGTGKADATGSGAATFSFTASAAGQADAPGSGAASFTFTATGAGVAGQDGTGSGLATFGFTAAGVGRADTDTPGSGGIGPWRRPADNLPKKRQAAGAVGRRRGVALAVALMLMED